MKKDITELKILDLVYSIQEHDWIQIRDNEQLQIIKRHWGNHFFGIELSEAVVNRFWTDFIQKYHSDYIKEFEYIDDSDNGTKMFSFFGQYSQKDLNPIVKGKLLEDSCFEEDEGFFQDFPDSIIFKNCYCYLKGKKVHFRYVHELQRIMCSYKIDRCTYGNMTCYFGNNFDL